MVADIVKQKYDDMAVYNERTTQAISTIQNEKGSGKYHIAQFDDTGSDETNNIVKNLTVLFTAIVEGISEATTQIKGATKEFNKSGKSGSQFGGLASTSSKINELREPGGNVGSDDTNKPDQGILETSVNGASELGKVLVQKGILASSEAVTGIINFILKSTIGDAVFGESGKPGRGKINQRILLLTAVVQQLANDPLARKAIQDLSKEVTQETLEIINITKPEIDKIVAEILTLINDVAAKSAAGLTSTAINVAMSVLGEIPFVGGLIDLTISAGRGFNALMKVTNVFVTKSSNATVQMNELRKKIANVSGNNIVGKERMLNTAANLKNIVTKGLSTSANTAKNVTNSDVLQNAKDMANKASGPNKIGVEPAKDLANKVADTVNPVNTVGGANKITNTRKLRSHLAKSNRRLRKTIKLFHNTLPRIKYRTSVNKKKYKM